MNCKPAAFIISSCSTGMALHVRLCMYACTCVRTCVCVHACVPACVHVCVGVGVGMLCTHALMPVCAYVAQVAGMPMCAVSLGVVCNSSLLVGAVYNPFADEMFSARRGQGE